MQMGYWLVTIFLLSGGDSSALSSAAPTGPGARTGRLRPPTIFGPALTLEIGRSESFAAAMKITAAQQKTFLDIDRQRIENRRRFLRVAAPGSDEYEKGMAKEKEFENQAIAVLTPEQKAVWDERKAQLQREQETRETEHAAMSLLRGEAFARSGEPAKAVKDLARAYASQPDRINLAQNWAYVLFGSGNVEGYRKACVRLRERFGDSEDSHVTLILGRILILSPEATKDTADLLSLAQKAVKMDPNNWWTHHVLAGANLRDGKFEEALKTLDQLDESNLIPALPSVDAWMAPILNDSLRAIVLLKLKRTAEARKVLATLQQSSDVHLKATPELPLGEITRFWWNWYPIQAFHHEAEQLLQEADAKHGKK